MLNNSDLLGPFSTLSHKAADDIRTGASVEALKQAICDNLFYVLAKFPAVATRNDQYLAVAYTVRDRLLERWISTARNYLAQKSRTVCYLSAEYLLGPQLGNNLINLGLFEQMRQAVRELGLDLSQLLDQEEEPGLGNGGLGRLAACFLDSLATLEIPTIGYGIRYEFGIFDQEIRDGWQYETPDQWLRLGNPWEIPRLEIGFEVPFGGRTESWLDEMSRYRVRWIPDRVVKGVAYDTPLLGYGVPTANLLRLWKAVACESFDFQAYHVGDYYRAVEQKIVSENITKVLYPNDEFLHGKELRLQQQYFFVSCSLQDMIRLYLQRESSLDHFAEKFAVQLNDTHPSIAVAELMRLLVDEHGLSWDQAWEITQQTFAYTNHTLLSEALEAWPVEVLRRLLPRPLEIIYEINHRFLTEIRSRFPGEESLATRLSLIDESGERRVRMAHLAAVGSHAINGVSEMHTQLLRDGVLRDFHRITPEKFSNKTNGVTPRRFLLLCNPRLTMLISDRIGTEWPRQLEDLRQLEPLAEDPEFQEAWREVKLANKNDLAAYLKRRLNLDVRADSLFDVQVKRLHEYKRQHLNVLHVIALYLRLKEGQGAASVPRTVIFGGKAAPGYFLAKLIIRLIHGVAEVINQDRQTRDLLQVVFIPDYNVQTAQRIFPAADLSEQISLAGKEASGTGNMKFAMNGAVTIGTADGANIEIRQEVGADNFFLFGLDASQAQDLRSKGYYPRNYYDQDAELRAALDLIADGYFSRGDRDLFRPLIDALLHRDEYLALADFRSYLECQHQVSLAYTVPARWTRMSILNVARVGKFSSDRAIQEYCRDIWRTTPVPIEINRPCSDNSPPDFLNPSFPSGKLDESGFADG